MNVRELRSLIEYVDGESLVMFTNIEDSNISVVTGVEENRPSYDDPLNRTLWIQGTGF